MRSTIFNKRSHSCVESTLSSCGIECCRAYSHFSIGVDRRRWTCGSNCFIDGAVESITPRRDGLRKLAHFLVMWTRLAKNSLSQVASWRCSRQWFFPVINYWSQYWWFVEDLVRSELRWIGPSQLAQFKIQNSQHYHIFYPINELLSRSQSPDPFSVTVRVVRFVCVDIPSVGYSPVLWTILPRHSATSVTQWDTIYSV